MLKDMRGEAGVGEVTTVLYMKEEEECVEEMLCHAYLSITIEYIPLSITRNLQASESEDGVVQSAGRFCMGGAW